MSSGLEQKENSKLARVLELAQTSRSEDPTEVVHRVVDQCLISMVFQPIVDMKTGRIFSYEALCRSRVPQFDNPPALIEAATAAGRIGELGRLQRALASRNCPDWPIFVNISPNEFDESYLVRPDDAIFKHRQPVYVEITESVPLVFFEQCHSVLAELRRKGARLAIDDLGAGYSNLKYIADLAPDIVKLDRELVAGCAMEGHQFELLRSIAQLCSQVDARVVAEGVENPEELEAVSAAGIDYCQGFFLGRPKISPSELSWPASELVTSAEFKIRRAARAAERCEASAEDSERRLEELEEVRSILEKSVRKAKGEVVRLRKAVNSAEQKSELAQVRLAELEDSLVESETNRRRLARLFEAASLKSADEPTPDPRPERAPINLKRVASHGLIWAVGLLAGLMLYIFDPRGDDVAPRVEPGSIVASSADPIVAAPPAVQKLSDEATAAAGEEIRALVLSWAESWSEQDVERYVSHYVPGFVSESGLSGQAWRERRRDRITSPGEILVEVSDLEIQLSSDDAASAVFERSYVSEDFADRVRKRFDLVRYADSWRIGRESSLE